MPPSGAFGNEGFYCKTKCEVLIAYLSLTNIWTASRMNGLLQASFYCTLERVWEATAIPISVFFLSHVTGISSNCQTAELLRNGIQRMHKERFWNSKTVQQYVRTTLASAGGRLSHAESYPGSGEEGRYVDELDWSLWRPLMAYWTHMQNINY